MTLAPTSSRVVASVAYAGAGLAETGPRHSYDSSLTLTSGVMQLSAIALTGGVTLSSITFVTFNVGATTPDHQIFGIYDNEDGIASGAWARLAQTADATTAAWGPLVEKTLSLTTPYTPPVSGRYYLALLVTAAGMPNICASSSSQPAQRVTSNVQGGASGSGLTALPNPATAPTAEPQPIYGHVS